MISSNESLKNLIVWRHPSSPQEWTVFREPIRGGELCIWRVMGNDRDAYENGQVLPNNTENNPQRDGKEHIKAIVAIEKKIEVIKDKANFVSFLNLFKSLNVNLSLLELIDKILKYAKYLKEIMARHKKIVLIAKKIPLKLKDPGSFTIPIKIGIDIFAKPSAI
ncbi:Transposon Ty3-I Gag-Pol polyprotein [Gossypium australe]|uniref:Transposon Ty3-I Gag-Pol polyprotein n=1 Tax=Gossypium australe TaxID=47621 RepID=A0A5B6WRC9_9ROSI|nr:Transposon Ty3-I Gag-Pol polyprotein [Gossypium australe]